MKICRVNTFIKLFIRRVALRSTKQMPSGRQGIEARERDSEIKDENCRTNIKDNVGVGGEEQGKQDWLGITTMVAIIICRRRRCRCLRCRLARRRRCRHHHRRKWLVKPTTPKICRLTQRQSRRCFSCSLSLRLICLSFSLYPHNGNDNNTNAREYNEVWRKSNENPKAKTTPSRRAEPGLAWAVLATLLCVIVAR